MSGWRPSTKHSPFVVCIIFFIFYFPGSLAFTKLHLNRYWRFTLEVWVTVHSGVIAVQSVPNIMGKELWPMFVFGFATAIILTQVSKHCPLDRYSSFQVSCHKLLDYLALTNTCIDILINIQYILTIKIIPCPKSMMLNSREWQDLMHWTRCTSIKCILNIYWWWRTFSLLYIEWKSVNIDQL